MKDSEKCLSCLGLAPKDKRGFTVWDNEAFCEECKSTVEITQGKQFTTEKGWQGISVYCPVHKTQL